MAKLKYAIFTADSAQDVFTPANAKSMEYADTILYQYLMTQPDIYDYVDLEKIFDTYIYDDKALRCCNASQEDLVFGDEEYYPGDIDSIIYNEFNDDVNAFIKYLEENDMLIDESDKEYANYYYTYVEDEIVPSFTFGNWDFSKMFDELYNYYGIKTTVDCLQILING